VAPVPGHQGLGPLGLQVAPGLLRGVGEVRRRRTSALGAGSKRARALPSCRQRAKGTLASGKRRWSLTGEGGKAGAILSGEGVLG
jgi:hypothetical protein